MHFSTHSLNCLYIAASIRLMMRSETMPQYRILKSLSSLTGGGNTLKEQAPNQALVKAAKIIRILTVPPIPAAAFLITAYFETNDIFRSPDELQAAVMFLSILPLLAYPLFQWMPGEHTREKQRKMAFLFTLAGYALGFLYGFLWGMPKMKAMFFSYFSGVVLLSILNKGFHIRASGHGASGIAPVILSFQWISTSAASVFMIIFLLSCWSSVKLKRHRPSELLFGAACFALSFLISKWIFL